MTKNNYILGSHNSWSFLPPKHWWMTPFSFMAHCQRVDIRQQYELGVRCFDLRLLVSKNGGVSVAHGLMKYSITIDELLEDLQWIDDQGGCYVRILHEARTGSQYTETAKNVFCTWCDIFKNRFHNIRFWCGRNLYNWQVDYDFGQDPSCHEDYSSVSDPKYIDDWWPYLYAKTHNRKIREKGTDCDILLIDYVDIK